MRILLDQSPSEIARYQSIYGADLIWQLRTPLTRYRIAEGTPYGLDNGAFSRFDEKTWRRLLIDAHEIKPIFVCLPDIVGSARRTLELFRYYKPATNGLPRALVLQDGIGDFDLPWWDFDAVFIGGSDQFKLHPDAFAAARTAKMLGKWVHVGRVNTAERVKNWIGIADSIDGSGISRYDHMLEAVVRAIRGEEPIKQLELDYERLAEG